MDGDDWRPLAKVETLEQRSKLIWSIREHFQRAGYTEVQTPTLSGDTVIDRYIDPIVVRGQALNCAQANAAEYYLQTSPEFAMKRLVAAGMNAIYQLCPAFRAGERGQLHNPEFTMLEWYKVGQALDDALQFLADLVDHVLRIACKSMLPTQIDTYASVFKMRTGLDPLECADGELPALAKRLGIELGGSWDDQSRDDWLNLIFAESIQPQLGYERPVLVTNYPASQAALAAVSAADPRTAERYELFVNGVEIANGYHELLDADELLARSREALDQRQRDGKAGLSLNNRLTASMRAGLPDCCGCALGVDRLVMVALGLSNIDSVIAFGIDRA